MGVVLDQSKPRGLDVGVLTHAFLLFYVISFSSLTLWLRLSLWIRRCVEGIGFRLSELVQSLKLCRFVFVHWDECVEAVSRDLVGSISRSLGSLVLSGGGAC